MKTTVEAFLTRRPHYSEIHVKEIAEHCASEGIPFCVGCADWHFTEEDHTED